jgi:hypothetical protein
MKRNEAERLWSVVVFGLVFLIGTYVIMVTTLGCNFKGRQGDPGIDGASPIVKTSPADVIECPNGGVEVSVNGNVTVICNGQNGQPGTQVTMIRFCPNVTPSYPSTFPEYGFCIDNNMYGVYSTNGGFLSLLPPGLYISNAVGSSCNFTIAANCQVF